MTPPNQNPNEPQPLNTTQQQAPPYNQQVPPGGYQQQYPPQGGYQQYPPQNFGGQEIIHSDLFDIIVQPFWYRLYNFRKFIKQKTRS